MPLFFLMAFLWVFPMRPAEAIPCGELRQAVEQLDERLLEWRAEYRAAQMSRKKYHRKLKKLRRKEERIYRKVRKCSFPDMQEYNYWYRSRLKFPSMIQQELRLLELEMKDE